MIYFDPTNPLYLSREATFDGVRVAISEDVLDFIENYTTLLLDMQVRIYEGGANEDFAQELAENYIRDLGVLLNAQSNS